MGCVLRVTGKHFDVDAHLARSGLTPCKVLHAGEPRSASRPETLMEISGFNVVVSQCWSGDLSGQISDAIAFLDAHEHAIKTLRSAEGVDDIYLDFSVDLRIDRRKVMAQFDYFPPALVSRAGALDLGLEISIYPKDFEQLARARARKASRAR